MSTTRIVTAQATGATTVDLTLLGIHGQVDVVVDPTISTAEVTVSTSDDTGDSADAVTGAQMHWDQRGALMAHVQGRGSSGGGTTIINRSGGGVSVIQTAGVVRGRITGMVISGDMTIVNGQVINGQETTVVQGPAPVSIRARVPEGSSVIARTQSADLATTGRLTAVVATTQAGDVRVLTPDTFVDQVTANTQSGDVTVGTASTVGARTQSGDIDLDRVVNAEANSMSGDIRVRWIGANADLQAMSGDIRAHAGNPAQVTANSMSGDVTVTASPEALGAVDVRATSMTGRVRTPR